MYFNQGKVVWGFLIFVTLFSFLAPAYGSVFYKPTITESWWHPLRWDDRKGYHPGVKEYFQPQVSGACVIVGSHSGVLTCRDRVHGFLRWEKKLAHPLLSGVALKEGMGYAVSQDGFLFKFGVHTGTVFWKEDLGKGFVTKPVIYGNSLYLISVTSELIKYDLESRAIAWTYRNTLSPTISLMGGSPVLMHPEGFLVYGLPAGRTVALNDKTGAVRWITTLPVGQKVEDVDAPITLLPKGLMLISSAYSMTHVVNKNGQLFQSWSFGSPRGATSFQYNGKVYVIQGDFGQVRSLGAISGKVITIPVDPSEGYPMSPQLIKAPYVALAFSKGSVMILDGSKMTYRWIRRSHGGPGLSSAPTVTSEGALFLFTNYSNLFRLELNMAKLTLQL